MQFETEIGYLLTISRRIRLNTWQLRKIVET
jgi:hypothetical protein